MNDIVCFRCKQAGHVKAECPHRQEAKPPAAASAKATAAPYKRKDTIECPVCQRDWVAVFTSPVQALFTTWCPWCRTYQTEDDGTIRRRDLVGAKNGPIR